MAFSHFHGVAVNNSGLIYKTRIQKMVMEYEIKNIQERRFSQYL